MIIVMDLSRFKQEINDCFEASFHCDASIDWAQEDQFMLLKTIDKSGEESLQYIGLGKVNYRGAKGHLQALKDGATGKALKIANYMTMDRQNKNVREHNGLWKLI